MIRKAEKIDIDAILLIVSDILIDMKENKNDQWSQTYPVYNDFAEDISAGDLFVDADEKGHIMSFFCLNNVEPSEYKSVQWQLDKKALVIHRMAVNPEFQGRGLAKKIMIFAEEKAKSMNLDYIRSDTCNQNISMNSLFEKLKYQKSGEVRFSDSVNIFNCYDKILS